MPDQRRGRSRRWVVPAISLGGMFGAGARYALDLAWPTATGAFPWTTLGINVLGSLLIGMLMVYVVEVGRASTLLRPFLGTGVLGGFTTFSTYTIETHTLLVERHHALAVAYFLGTLAAALIAVALGVVAARAMVRRT